MLSLTTTLAVALGALGVACTSARETRFDPPPPPKLNDDEFTRYELLEPETHAYRIAHEVSAVGAGARACFLFMRGGATVGEVSAEDRFTGERLDVGLLDGKQAAKLGRPGAVAGETYLTVPLPRPVPAGGEARLVIRMRYEDPQAYRFLGDRILFERLLGSKGVAVVLPPHHVLVSTSHPVQVRTLEDGRIEASLLDPSRDWITLRLEARRLAEKASVAAREDGPVDASSARSPATEALSTTSTQGVPPSSVAEPGARPLPALERAHEEREIVYVLEAPETHSFRLHHDFTVSRPGADHYLNVVRAGSRVSNPRALLLDTGEALAVEEMTGAAALAAGYGSEHELRPEAEVVLVRHPPVAAGRSIRVRIEETYTDPERYYLDADELVWDRSFGRTRNALVLPAGWHVVANAIPATVSETADGRTRLDYVNPRPDTLAVWLRARRDIAAR